MRVIYADDAPDMLEEVCDYLRQAGHQAVPLHTDKWLDFQDRLTFMLDDGFKPDAIIMGGHNVMRNTDGTPLLDLDAFTINGWLDGLKQRQILPACKLVLFSRDDKLRELAYQHPDWGFQIVVAKEQPASLSQLLMVLTSQQGAV